MDNKYIEKCSVLLIIKEIQIKTTVLALVRIAIIKTKEKKCQ
jgi:hypothetical protein